MPLDSRSGTGLILLLRFDFAPGHLALVPASWPKAAKLPHCPGRQTLLLFAHPRCPCTLATLEQLRQLLARASVPTDCHVVFLVPTGAEADWNASLIVRTAEAIPHAKVVFDSGPEIRRFAVTTSGHALLYDSRGQLAYSGGMTFGRGHRGDNPGAEALYQMLNQLPPRNHRAPTFGCPLFNNSSCPVETECPR